MTLDYQKLLCYQGEVVEQKITPRDVILYALGVGFGQEPTDLRQLQFVFEKKLQVLPMMAVTLAYPGAWYERANAGATRARSVHGEQGFRIHKPLPVAGTVCGQTRCVGVVDKGEGKGALLYTECEVFHKERDEHLCTLTSTTFLRADGGFGGQSEPRRSPHFMPNRRPDKIEDIPTRPEMALIYRMSGDFNPLHVDPEYARSSGFNSPILHGRATFAVAGHAILKTYCNYMPNRLQAMEARFSAPVYPGETIRTEMWLDGEEVSFLATVVGRSVAVLTNGWAKISG